MIIYIANCGNREKIDYIENNNNLGLCYTPLNNRNGFKGRIFLDNGAFHYFSNNMEFICAPFIKLLKKQINYDFAVLPDIVMGGLKSLELSKHWLEWLPSYKWYLSVQDGITPENIYPFLGHIEGIFIGGSKKWKLDNMIKWIEIAHSNGIKCHIGRFGTIPKIQYAEKNHADSVDSSNASKSWPAWYRLKDYVEGKEVNMRGLRKLQLAI